MADGLDSGGSHQFAGGSVVVMEIEYGGDGVRQLHSYDSVTSPDEDGDMDVDEDDFVIWNEAFEREEPLYIGDLIGIMSFLGTTTAGCRPMVCQAIIAPTCCS